MPELLRRQPPSGRRYLLIVCAGDDSLHRDWLDATGHRNFDFLVSYYGNVPGQFCDDGEFYHVMPGAAFPVQYAIMRDNPDLIETYDYICFACDDLATDMATWNALFAACDRYKFDLAQPAILGHISYAITAPVKHLRYRLTNFVECMVPVFSRRALRICFPTFADSVSGWGLNHVWPLLLADLPARIAIIDSLRVTHTRALRIGPLYKLLDEMGIDPTVEMAAIMARAGIERTDIRELSRVYLHFAAAFADRVRQVFRRG